MNKVFALAAAALLVSVVGVNAKPTTTNISYSLEGQTCTAAVKVFNDRTQGITKDVLVAISENDSCGYLTGEGLIGKVTIATGTTLEEAIIGGATSAFPYPVTITLAYPLVTGGQYTISYTTDGKTISNAATGTYTVE